MLHVDRHVRRPDHHKAKVLFRFFPEEATRGDDPHEAGTAQVLEDLKARME
jgi:hypothetical protein